jgi:hypothetical protein
VILFVILGQLEVGPTTVRAQWRGELVVGARAFQDAEGPGGRAGEELDLELRPRAGIEWSHGTQRLDIAPFLRVDLLGDGRSQLDLRELAWTGLWNDWVVSAGFREVFWGVTESSNVVDVINQRSPAGSLDGFEKLGQPMVGVRLDRAWGLVELMLLPWFRERQFEGRAGSLWSPLAVSDGATDYESEAGRHHVDWAVRWSHTFGDVDLAVAHLAGTSREPTLQRGASDGGHELWIPYYELTDVTGAEFQWTTGAWLWKAEAMTRTSTDGRYGAGVGGLEYAVGDFLSLFAEFALDTRGSDALTSFENDAYIGARLLFQDGQARVGFFVDTRSGNRILRASFQKRLGDRFTADLGARWHGGDSGAEPQCAPWQGSLLSFALVTYF